MEKIVYFLHNRDSKLIEISKTKQEKNNLPTGSFYLTEADIESFEKADSIADEASDLTGIKFSTKDNGPRVTPRYSLIVTSGEFVSPRKKAPFLAGTLIGMLVYSIPLILIISFQLRDSKLSIPHAALTLLISGYLLAIALLLLFIKKIQRS